LGGLGHVAQGLTWDTHPLGYRADGVDAGRRARMRFARSAPREFDLLHGQGGRAWFSHLDFAWARSRDTTCVIQYNGSETWISDLAARLHPRRGAHYRPVARSKLRRHPCLGTLVAHAAVVQDLELATYLTSDYRAIYVAPFAIDLEAVERARGPNRGGPLATACASCTRRPDRFIKWSAAIEEIVARSRPSCPSSSSQSRGWRAPRCSRQPPGRTS
jgi:hypothetical protein